MNQDPSELSKFNLMSSDWWNPTGSFRALHDMNPLRLSWIESITPPKGKKILDIGCGGGILSEALAKSGAEVTAIDLAENALDTAKAHARISKLQIGYRLISAEDLALEQPSKYDAITCMELLEHVPNPECTVKACATLLKTGGYCFFATINRNIKSLFHAIIGAEYLLSLLPVGTHDFGKFITPSDLGRFARKNGLSVEAITGVTCDLSAKHFSLTTDSSINYMLACQKY
jgi:2-polyprenyl-6-hydroxyphenyl methylase/3-demethylubiquinone-9 3-methyltransferase